MTVIRHNSISGIVSITAAAGSNLAFYDSTGSTLSLDTGDINAGVITATTANFTNATISGDLTVNGTTTTLDTTVTEVDRLEVGANNSTVGVAITQSGSGDILRLYDGATQVVTVTDGGNLLVGANDAGGWLTKIQVADNASYQSAFNITNNVNADLQFEIKSNESRFGPSTNTPLVFKNGGGERLRITSSGDVGIGTDNPGSTLDVRGSGLFGYDAVNTTSIIKGFSNSHNSANRGAKIRFGLNDGSFGGVEVENVQGGNPSHNSQTVHLVTHNGGIAGDIKAVTARYDGNVGIGSDSPDASLVVDSGITPTTIKITSNTESSIDFNDKGGTPKRYKIGTNISSNDGQFEIKDMTANAERLRITSDGNIGIGADSLDSLEARTSQAYRSLRLQNANITAGNSQYAYYGVNYYQDTSGVLRYIDTGYSGRIEMWGDYMSFNLSTGNADNSITSSEALRITSDHDIKVTQTPGRYTIDSTNGATTIANGGTVDFASASGMLVVNNWANGNVTIYICGGGAVTVVANTGSNVGSFTYNAGIAGYRWTNNYGSNAVFGFFFVRTRTTA